MARSLISAFMIWISYTQLILCSTIETSNTEILSGNSSINAASLSTIQSQPALFGRFCFNALLRSSNRFQYYPTNGVLTVYCHWNSISVQNMIFSDLVATGHLTTDPELMAARNKSISYLKKDNYVSMCLLNCNRGEPYPRFNQMASADIIEPYSLNIGCDDMSNMKCKETCLSTVADVANGVVTCTEGVFDGSICQLRCDPGYYARGGSQKICRARQSSWLPEIPFACDATCPLSLLLVENGKVQCTDSTFVGSVCTLKCDQGYEPVGLTERSCHMDNKVWMPQENFGCKVAEMPITCEPLPQITNGVIECSNNYSLLSECTMICANGYIPYEPMIHYCLPNEIGNGSSWYWLTADHIPQLALPERTLNCTAAPTEDRTPGFQPAFLENIAFNAQLKRLGYCRVEDSDKGYCRNFPATRAQCERNGCCWDPSPDSPIRCYMNRHILVNQAFKAPSRITPGSAEASTPQLPDPNQPQRIAAAILASQAVDYVAVSRPNSLSYVSNPDPNSAIMTCGCKQQAGISERCSIIQGILGRVHDKKSTSARVCGGVDSEAAHWPWQTVVYYDGMLCGGTLVAPQYIITAAHCLSGSRRPGQAGSSQRVVALGTTNISNPDDPHLQIRNIRNVAIHPNFTDSGYARNDIAILKLESPADVSGYWVRPLCLPENRIASPTDKCFVTGFGIKEVKTRRKAVILQAARVPIVSRGVCQRFYYGYRLDDTNMCAGSTRPGAADTCQGDSGGPLVCRKAGLNGPCNWYLAGVTSFGLSPCGQGHSGVYTNVHHFQTWIRSTVFLMSRNLHV